FVTAPDSLYREQFTFPILRLLSSSEVSNKVPSNQIEKYLKTLQDVISILYDEAEPCFISKQYIITTLHNISCNELYAPLVASVCAKFKLNREYKLHLKHHMEIGRASCRERV